MTPRFYLLMPKLHFVVPSREEDSLRKARLDLEVMKRRGNYHMELGY